jgi:hypothetical protein
MTVEELESRVKALEEIVKSQVVEIRTLKDIEEINKLQNAYGYYLEHWMAQEVIDLFADGPEVSLTLNPGTFKGKAGVKRYFENTKPTSEFMHQMMQLSGIVDVAPDGKTAKGRWYGFGAIAMPRGDRIGQNFMAGIYTVDYIKESGVWKFRNLTFDIVYLAKPLEGWVKPERQATADAAPNPHAVIKADVPRTYYATYPSGYIVPFHFKHPVTGQPTSENSWNASLKKRTI